MEHDRGEAARIEHAICHLENAVRFNDALGCTVWRIHAERLLERIVPDHPLAN